MVANVQVLCACTFLLSPIGQRVKTDPFNLRMVPEAARHHLKRL
jgi:hypothetical protein